MYTICKSFKFSASHRLDHLPPGHKCARLHGHTYEVVFELSSTELDATGFVQDYGELSQIKAWIDQNLDHYHLNDKMPAGVPPTAENIARHLFEAFSAEYPLLTAVTVKESPETSARYTPYDNGK
jgi:6-pyruvoyltetrahydropterin/6-carboxytetrahydropterin synthase